MDALLTYQFWLWVAGGLLLIRQLCIEWAAEQGRKHDLVRKLYKPTQELHVSVLVPYLDSNQQPHLLALLQAINEQDYPASKVAIHLVATADSRSDLIPQALTPNVKVWEYPAPHPRYEHALTWLIERCLAAGGNSLFVFLRPTDMIKPDFFQNVVSRGLDSFAVQGYVALKNPPETPLAKVYALSTRLFNRIGNAGRYHMGLSCRLLDTAWAVKQEVLEMIPYHRGLDLDNLEYSIRLNLEGFRVNWAPNVVVYADSDVHFLQHLTTCVGTFLNRCRLLLQYGPSLLLKTIFRGDLNYLEQCLSIIKPPYMLLWFSALLLGVLEASQKLALPDDSLFWFGMAGAFLVLNTLGLVVARCKGDDYAVSFFWAPITYVIALLSSPVGIYAYLMDKMTRRSMYKAARYQYAQSTRLNEDLEPIPELLQAQRTRNLIQPLLEEDEQAAAYANPSHVPQNRMKLPREQVKVVPLTNGKKQVDCRLRTLTSFLEDGQEVYRLTLEYKTMSFSTELYRILDQAFYELQSKLMSRGFTIVTCGSCGHFYNPTADMPGALKNAGVCLFGKAGKDVNLNTDAVTVISQACSYHCPLEHRESIVRQWKESLVASQAR